MKTIVIVGGGAGGLELATRLGRRIGKSGRAHVILVDRAPTHFWKPLLHAVAAGKIDPNMHHIDYAVQAANNHFEFVCGNADMIDRASRIVEVRPYASERGCTPLPVRRIRYDRLVLAFGAVTNFFNIPGAADHSLALDTVQQAEFFRKRFLMRCMQASAAHAGANESGAAVNIIIVGGGATGVELAAELKQTVQALAQYKVHSLDAARDIRIRIIERADRLLPFLSPEISRAAARQLQRLGIEVCTNTSVARVDSDAVVDSSGTHHHSSITVWAAGVEGPGLCARLGLRLNRNKQIRVNNSLQTLDDPNIFAIGDCANVVCANSSVAVPPRAQAAHQQAKFLADILADMPAQPEEQRLPAFSYRDYGSLISLGQFGAVGVLLGAFGRRELHLSGAAAQAMYKLMYQRHVLSLLGFARMMEQALMHWIRARMVSPVRLH